MYEIFAKKRILLSRVITIILFVFIVATHPKLHNTLWYYIFSTLGNILVITGILGRIFASLFMSDNRNVKLVKSGLYSVCRNPLYFFSFLSTIGLCLIYGSIIITILVNCLYLLYYYYIISFEQKELSKKIGQDYIDYINSGVPKFFPNFALWKSDVYVTVNYKVVLQTMLDAFWFFFAILFIYILLKLQYTAIVPTLFYIL